MQSAVRTRRKRARVIATRCPVPTITECLVEKAVLSRRTVVKSKDKESGHCLMTFAEKDCPAFGEEFRNLCYPANIPLIHQSVIEAIEKHLWQKARAATSLTIPQPIQNQSQE